MKPHQMPGLASLQNREKSLSFLYKLPGLGFSVTAIEKGPRQHFSLAILSAFLCI
jgi:hypothetical protein